MVDSVLILGGGESGVGAALLANSLGMYAFVSDFGTIALNYRLELQHVDIGYEQNGHEVHDWDKYDLVVKSPGIPNSAPPIKTIHQLGIPIISELDFASRYYEGGLIGITGSNGKTTTTHMVYHLLKNKHSRVCMAGNVGYAFSRAVAMCPAWDYIVLEISSFQLDDSKELLLDYGILLNITADHLDRYDYDISKYAFSKWSIYSRLKRNGVLLVNQDDPITQDFTPQDQTKKIIAVSSDSYDGTTIEWGESRLKTPIPGVHNAFNALCAASVSSFTGMSSDEIQTVMNDYVHIPHRLEEVCTIDNVLYVNDSKATNVDAVKMALQTYDNIIWVVGGVDKGNDYSVLESLVSNKVKHLFCLTKDDSALRKNFEETKPMETLQDLDVLLQKIHAMAESGDVVLLSPACASFDLFDNYIDRGDKFKRSVYRLLKAS